MASEAVAAAPIEAQVLSLGDRAAAGALWRSLEHELGAGLACSWDWTETWLEHFGRLTRPSFVVGFADGRPCGIALLAHGRRRRGGIPLRTLHVGTAGEPAADSVYVESNRVLVRPECRAGFARAVLAAAAAEPGWDELRLDGFAAEDAEAFLAVEPRFRRRAAASPLIDLELVRRRGGDATVLFGKATRYGVRRTLRTAGEVTVEWASDAGEATDIFAELVRLHQRRWQGLGESGVFASRRFTDFHRDAILRLLPSGRAILVRVRAAGGTLGCVYALVDGEDVLAYQAGFELVERNKVSVGMLVVTLVANAAAERGFRRYEHLAPPVRYKVALSTGDRPIVWAWLPRRRPRPALAVGLQAAKRLAGG